MIRHRMVWFCAAWDNILITNYQYFTKHSGVGQLAAQNFQQQAAGVQNQKQGRPQIGRPCFFILNLLVGQEGYRAVISFDGKRGLIPLYRLEQFQAPFGGFLNIAADGG